MVNYSILISAILSAFFYESFGIATFISIVPLLLLSKPIIRQYWIWGFTYMAILHLFFIELHTTSNILVAIGLWLIGSLFYSSYYALIGFVAKHTHQRFNQYFLVIIPFIWAGFEWLKNSGSYANPLGNIGYSLSFYAKYIPIYSVIGPSGLTIAILIINAAIASIILTKQKKIPITIIIAILIGITTIEKSPSPSTKQLSVSVIQTSIPQLTKINRNNWTEIKKTYLKHIQSAKNELIILPESIIPTFISNTPFYKTIETHASTHKQAILFGSFLKDSEGVFNGTILVNQNKEPQYYKKERLMPFGEYLPFRGILNRFIPKDLQFNDFNQGTNNTTVRLNGHTISQQICLEGIYLNQIKQSDLLIIVANNAWFNDSSAGKKLRQFAMAHARTKQIPIIIAANIGESTIINSDGSVIQTLPNNNTAIIETVLNI